MTNYRKQRRQTIQRQAIQSQRLPQICQRCDAWHFTKNWSELVGCRESKRSRGERSGTSNFWRIIEYRGRDFFLWWKKDEDLLIPEKVSKIVIPDDLKNTGVTGGILQDLSKELDPDAVTEHNLTPDVFIKIISATWPKFKRARCGVGNLVKRGTNTRCTGARSFWSIIGTRFESLFSPLFTHVL